MKPITTEASHRQNKRTDRYISSIAFVNGRTSFILASSKIYPQLFRQTATDGSSCPTALDKQRQMVPLLQKYLEKQRQMVHIIQNF